MSELDPRIVRVGVEIGDQLKTYDDLYVSASGSKFANPIQNECEIKIGNLARADREYLLTETSPYNKSRQRKRVFLWVGRVSTGVHLLFAGDIITSAITQPPDVFTILRAKTGQALKGQLVATSMRAAVPLSVLSKSVADALSLQLDFQATDKNIGNYSFTGAAAKQVEQLAELGRIDAFLDDQTLIIKDLNAPLKNVTHTLSADSGMVGIPELTDQGVRVKYLLDGASRIGSELVVESKMNPAASGTYTIFKLQFEVANREQPFYYIADGKRNGRTRTQ